MTIKDIIQKIEKGDKREQKAAKNELEQFWEQNKGDKKTTKIFLKEMEKGIKNFDAIKNVDNQVAFVFALKWFLLAADPSYIEDRWPDLKNFVLKMLQHKSGRVRYAMVRITFYLTISLRLFNLDGGKLSPKQKKMIAKHRLLFCELVEEVEQLIEKYFEPKFRKYKYIQSLPPSIYKSLQMFWNELLRFGKLKMVYRNYKYQKVRTRK